MTFERFGPFASAFETTEREGPAYLELLHLHDGKGQTALRRIREALLDPSWQSYAVKLLSDPNWRPHLVGGAALICKPCEEALPALWQAFDGGSWVAPQLAVAAYFSDAKFTRHARSRIEAGCAVKPPEGLSAIERHSATGPDGTAGRSAKNMACLLDICARVAELSSWAEDFQRQPGVREMLAIDEANNNSAGIAENWLRKISQLCAGEGIALEPAHQI